MLARQIASALKATKTDCEVIDLIAEGVAGAAFSLEVFNSEAGENAGNWTFKQETSIADAANLVTRTDADDIKAGHTYNGGPNSDGHDIYSFSPGPHRFLRILPTLNSGSPAKGIDLWLNIW